ncbi:MAG: hypothetical protein Q7S28_00360 [bacterium]|nr:hypothetical protein [bacterium]
MSEKKMAILRRQILNYGGASPYDELRVMKLLRVRSPQELGVLWRQGKLLCLPRDGWGPFNDGSIELLYPRWQFGAKGKLLQGLEEIILVAALLDDPWGVADILTSPQKIFNGRTPIDMLRDGDTSDVVRKTIKLIRRAYA